MEISLLSLLNVTPGAGVAKEGEMGGEGLEAPYSFEQWLSDIGVQDGMGADVPMPDIDFTGDLVPNLVLAEGGLALSPQQILAQLTGKDGVDAAALSAIKLTPEQSNRLSDMMRKFLQRPDVNATLGESQKGMLQQMMARLQAASGEGQPLAPVLKPLLQTQGVTQAELKERAPLVGQMMKWLKQVLRDTAKPAVAFAVTPEPDALAKGAALVGFPGDTAGADAQVETGEEDETLSAFAVPVVAVPLMTEAEPDADVTTGPASKGWAALADGLIEEAQAQDAAAQVDIDPVDVPVKTNKGIMSADFAQLLATVNTRDEAMVAIENAAPELTLKAAAALAQPTGSSERSLGGSVTGETKILGMSAQQEKALAQADSTQAVSAVVDAHVPQTDVTQANASGEVIEARGGVSATASGFQVGQANTPASTPALHYAHARVPVPEQVQVAIRQAAKDGMDRIMIQLQPEELGRIDVRLDMHADGRAHIVFTVDKADTFEQLQRDARFLEKALQDAGVKTDAGSMEFNLRQQTQQEAAAFGNGSGQQHNGSQQEFTPEDAVADTAAQARAQDTQDDAETMVRNYTLNMDQGLDIRI